MTKCIICFKEKITEDHIIPLAFGNKKYTLSCVCKKCNSLLGDNIDAANTNNILGKLVRKQNNIKGRAKETPNPFSEGIAEYGKRIRLTQDYIPTVVDSCNYDEQTKTYQISSSSPEKAIEIIDKELSRMNLPPLTEKQKDSIKSIKSKIYHPTIEYHFEFDILKYNLELIKIAYETLYYLYGDAIFSNIEVLKLREIIYNYIYKDDCDIEIFNNWAGGIDNPFGDGMISYLKKKTKSDALHIISVQIMDGYVAILIAVEGMSPSAVKLKSLEGFEKCKSRTGFVFYPSGEILIE